MPAKAVPLSMPRYAREILRELDERTRHGLRLGIQEGLGRDYQVHLAREEGEEHLVVVDEAYEDHIPHFLVSGAFLLRRLGDVSAEDQRDPAGRRGESIGAEGERELRARLPGMPRRVLVAMGRALYEDLLHQVVTTPPILRVEREIAETVPEHRHWQQAYLRRRLRDLEDVVGLAGSEVLPSGIYRAYSGIALVGAAEAAELMGRELGPPFCGHPYEQVAKRLRQALLRQPEPGYRGDRQIIDAWAKELGLEDWFTWVRRGST